MVQRKVVKGVVILAVVLVVAGIGAYFMLKGPEGGGEAGFEWFQTGNTLPITQLQTKQSGELENNRIGSMWDGFWTLDLQELSDTIFSLGLKRVYLSINCIDGFGADWTKLEFTIDPSHDDLFTRVADNGVTIIYGLSFWDKENIGKEISYPRFKSEEQIRHYLDFVQFIVGHFKDRVQYFEMWSEPDMENTIQWIEVEDYINLVERAVPVIREEYPEAKIVVGATMPLNEPESYSYEYFFTIISSDNIMPLVDAICWLPGPGPSPAYEYWRDYYYGYPSLVENIKDVASAHGFEGEYITEGMGWPTPETVASTGWENWPYSDTVAAKYYARSIVMHLGMDVAVGLGVEPAQVISYSTVQNLCTIMAGAEAISLPIEIQSEATNIENYSFSLSNGDNLVALWTDGVAVDEDPGVNATLTLPNFLAQEVTGIDVLTGYQQPITASNESGNLLIENLIVRDYPLILHITESSVGAASD